MDVCRDGFSMETRGEIFCFSEKKFFKKHIGWSARVENTQKVHISVEIELQDFNPMEKASLSM